MPESDFPEYGIKYSKAAKESRKNLPVELLATLDEIEASLADDPNRHPDRIIAANLDGTSKIYKHPDAAIQITFQINEEKKLLYFFDYSAPMFRVQETIFISYSHKNKEELSTLRNFLSELEQRGVINFWDDDKLEAGVPWEDQIMEKLKSAKAFLLLVSQEFLSSKFVAKNELPKLLDDAEKKGKKVFWLHLSPSTVFETHPQITRYQSVLEDPRTSLSTLKEPEQREALVEVARRLTEAISSN